MANKLVVAPAPHVQTSQSTARIMRDVVIALMPALAVSAVVFGVDVLRVTALSVAACVLFEYLIQKFLVRGASTIGNWSAVVTGVLLAFNLPASIPWWIVLIGAFVAIAIAKMTFGGLGKNPFNPALVGRVFLLIAYPVQMTSFPVPVNGSFDALSGATPLAAVKHGAAADVLGVQELLLGNMPGSLGEVAALALICGFVYLLWRRAITWQIPVTILGTMALFAFVVAAAKGGLSAGPVLWQFPLFHVLAGGALLGAIFMATDYSTSPMTVRGGVIFGVGHLGSQSGRLRLLQDIDVDHLAVGREAHHHVDRAAETVLGHRLHGISGQLAALGRGVDRDRHLVDGQRLGRRLIERREHAVQRGGFGRLLGLSDRFRRDHVHGAHPGRSDEGDAEEHGRHIQKGTFHICVTPILRRSAWV